MNSLDGALSQREGPPACAKVRDQDIFIVNPLYRLRDAKKHVLAYGVQGIGTYRLHKAVGITLALCNGQRTVADIARITRPFVKIPDDEAAIRIANHKVKAILHYMSMTKEEQRGEKTLPSDYPSAAVLMGKADYDKSFGQTSIPVVEYNAEAFLPKDVSELSNSEVRVVHDLVPVELNWHLTSECSTNCRYCYLGRRNVQSMPIERTLELIREAADIGVLCICPAGGDVLLYPHLTDVLEEMCRHTLMPVMLSTKSLLSKDKAKAIAGVSGVLWELQFSIDSTVDDVADYLAGTTGYCRRIFASIDNALEAGLHVTAKAVITPYNILTIPKLYRDLKKCGVTRIRLATYGRSGYHHTDDLFNHMDSYDWLQKQVDELRTEFPEDHISTQNGPTSMEPRSRESRVAGWKKRSCCTAGRTAMMICADGKVIPCEQMPETEEFFCGDVSYQSIQEVWNGKRLRELTYGIERERFKGQPCYNCEEREECHEVMGFCIRDLALHYGNIYQPPPNCPKFDAPFFRQI